VRVLIAEEHPLYREGVVRAIKERPELELVGEAADGGQALTLIEELQPDVAVLDVKMPGLDGLSAAEQIGERRLSAVVMLTAFSQRELVERARDAGALAYVVKPFTRADLVPAIEIALSRHSELVALEAEVADLAERFETRKRVDRAKSILMTQLGLTEPDAFRWIQKTSMDRRLSMREVADAVLAGLPGITPSGS
jgi:response regulator NasT